MGRNTMLQQGRQLKRKKEVLLEIGAHSRLIPRHVSQSDGDGVTGQGRVKGPGSEVHYQEPSKASLIPV